MSFFQKIKNKFSSNPKVEENNILNKNLEAEQSEVKQKINSPIVEIQISEKTQVDEQADKITTYLLEEKDDTANVFQIEEPKIEVLYTEVSDNTEILNTTDITDTTKNIPEEKKSFFAKTTSFFSSIAQKTKTGLTKTRQAFSDNLKSILGTGRKINETLLGEIEELLITADIGVDTTEQIIDNLRTRVKKEQWENSEDLYKLLQEEIQKIMIESPSANNDKIYEIPTERPYVILVIGVNGVGKTTTIGKLAHNYKNNGYNVIIGAADTFRAAANEQLEIWAKRANVDIVQQGQGADPAAVAFDTLKSAIAKQKDIVIIDTAGRLHNKKNLMDELEKINRVLKKQKPNAPNEVFLVLDATTGQNAILQAKEFAKVTNITGIVLTKLDGTAKGGVVIPIANELKMPVKYIGVGEKIDDLQPFDAKSFVEGLFDNNK